MWRLLCSALAAAILECAAQAQASDPRVRVIPYDPGRVITLPVAAGFASVVDVAPDETVDSVVVGNSAVWQITETHGGKAVVVKPLAGAVMTNMVIMTDQRRYTFLLDPSPEGAMQTLFDLRFTYSQAAASSAQVGSAATYSMHGDKALFPLRMYDDGSHTTISWSPNAPLPAVFVIDGSKDSVVNGRMVGDSYVIEGAAARYRFRLGDSEAIAVRRPASRSR